MNQSFHQNPEILSTLVIDAETFMLVSRLNAFSASMNSPSNFFFADDTILYIVNPFSDMQNRQLVRLSLPSLTIMDTLFLNAYCSPPCISPSVRDVGNDLAIIATEYAGDDSMAQVFKAVSTISKGLLGELAIPKERMFSPIKASPDGQFIVSGVPGKKIEVFNRGFVKLYEINDVAVWRLHVDTSGNATLIVDPIESDLRNEYAISTGRLIKSEKKPGSGK
jgi:hypothetical protein